MLRRFLLQQDAEEEQGQGSHLEKVPKTTQEPARSYPEGPVTVRLKLP